jgi:dienelactone hydrolase
MYAYDKTPLAANTESVDDSNDLWRKETVSYAATYGGERIPAYLFLPKNVKPPYQTVLWVPGGYALFLGSSATGATTDAFDFLIRTGRAVLYPVYKGTFERRIGDAAGPNAYREMMIQFAKDASRSLDYLETRSDIQVSRIGYYGISLGGTLGPVMLALDARLKVAVLVSGGLYSEKVPPEIDILNFAPRVSVPVLMLGGRFDFATPRTRCSAPCFASSVLASPTNSSYNSTRATCRRSAMSSEKRSTGSIVASDPSQESRFATASPERFAATYPHTDQSLAGYGAVRNAVKPD